MQRMGWQTVVCVHLLIVLMLGMAARGQSEAIPFEEMTKEQLANHIRRGG